MNICAAVNTKVIMVVQYDRISFKLRRTPQKNRTFIVEMFYTSKSAVQGQRNYGKCLKYCDAHSTNCHEQRVSN